MKIYSKFKDYYDGSIAQFRDETISWIRKTDNIDVELPRALRGIVGDLRYDWGGSQEPKTSKISIVGFCGRFYPVYSETLNFATHRFLYDKEEILKELKPYRAFSGWAGNTKLRYKLQREKIESVLEYEDDRPFIDANSPVLFFTPSARSTCCLRDINLSDVSFFKCKDSWEAMKDLTSYFSSILTRHDDIPEPDNKTKIKAAGFDLKQSFRKAPTKRK